MLLGLGGCNQLLGVHDFGATDDAQGATPDVAPGLPECKAQRVVHLVNGSGGFGWITIAWPVPVVIQNFMATYAYDNPSLAMDVGAESTHPLYARKINSRAIWLEVGTHPQPSVFVAGTTEVHTNNPTSVTASGGISIDAMAAGLQRSLDPMIPAVVIGSLVFGSAPDAPTPAVVSDALGAPNLFPASYVDALTPTPVQLSRYLPQQGDAAETAIARGLAFSANAFKLGLVGTVMLPGFQDDAHGAFMTPANVTARGNHLATMVDAFYADLLTTAETTCGHDGLPLSLADNTVFITNGDTPKDPFHASGWPDGPPGNANLLYVRTNGFTRPGWFGSLDPATGRTNFDPNTGLTSPSASITASTGAAWAGMLHAIARGDRSVVSAVTSAPYAGVISVP